MIGFGKYKYDTYDYVIQNDKSYCKYILSLKNKTQYVQDFCDYILQHNVFDLKNLRYFDIINCSSLKEYMISDNNVLNLINRIEINKLNIDYKIDNIQKITTSLFNNFINILIRYEISKLKNMQFDDFKTHHLCDKNNLKLMNYVYENMNKSYIKMINDDNVTLTDILNVSIGTFLYHNKESDQVKYLNFCRKDVIDETSYDNIKNYISFKIKNRQNILLNTEFYDEKLHIKGDVNLILDNELITIKLINDISQIDFIQLIIYATLYYKKTDNICNKLTIYNPILGEEHIIFINKFIIQDFIEILENYKIGSEKNENSI